MVTMFEIQFISLVSTLALKLLKLCVYVTKENLKCQRWVACFLVIGQRGPKYHSQNITGYLLTLAILIILHNLVVGPCC